MSSRGGISSSEVENTPQNPNTSKKASRINLCNLIYSKEWDNVVAACESDAYQAKLVDRTGDLPLHEACQKAAPFEVIKNLVSAFPEGVKTKGFCGRLPIHYASYNKPSLHVIKLLLENYPDGASMLDSDGRLPIHLAVVRNAPKAAIKELIDAYPKSLQIPNKFGNTPRMLARNNSIGSMLEEVKGRPKAKERQPFSMNGVEVIKRLEKVFSRGTITKQKIDSNKEVQKHKFHQNGNACEPIRNRPSRRQKRRHPQREQLDWRRRPTFETTRGRIETRTESRRSSKPTAVRIARIERNSYSTTYTANTNNTNLEVPIPV